MSEFRTVRVPDDVRGGWFVVDGQVEYLQGADWARRRGSRRDVDRTVVVAGRHRFAVGSTVEVAEGAALDAGFRDTVRRLWRGPITIVVMVVVTLGLEASGVPWRTGIGREAVVGLAAAPVVFAATGTWSRLTRAHDGRVVRSMAGWRIRARYGRQRATTR